ncbi:MAG: ATP-binding protein [Prolixibacteraceae bacterium]|nr:ATP-binding protein [Prolixibacteraceae bacterium]
MQKLIERNCARDVQLNRKVFPVTAILGPRQCGKTTLVKMLSDEISSIVYLDLQNIEDVNKLSDPRMFFRDKEGAVICLDEIQRMPELFNDLRSIIDSNRQKGRFIILGSASPQLIQKSSETLAGRIGFIELTPFLISELIDNEVKSFELNDYIFKGGFPESFLSENVDESKLWLENFIRTYIERDLPQLGIQLPSMQIRRLLTMLSHTQGQLFNSNKLAESMGVTHPTIRRYVDLFEQTFLVRTLQPFILNVKKRLVKSAKVYVRDSGILHQLLQINDFDHLLGHPVFGSSWEGIVVENVIAEMPGWQPYFYRTATGDEVDLVMVNGDRRLAIECKASTAPKLTKGFWNVLNDIKPEHVWVVALVNDSYPIKENVTVCGLPHLFPELRKIG